ncbi:MAG: ATP-binding protein [Clostridiaceae bacterium]|nr:ATP-binding protein [Clostridiaceae bacterium]
MILSRDTLNRKILARYAATRSRSENDLARRREMLLESSPELQAIEADLAWARGTWLAAKAAGHDPTEAEAELVIIRESRDAWLRARGLNLDDDVPEYECPHCGDRGVIDLDTHISAPGYTLASGTCPHCWGNTAASLIQTAGQLQYVRNCSFAYFDATLFSTVAQGRAMQALRQALELSADDFAAEGRDWLFHGLPGTGKTFMAGSLANALAERGIYALYMTATGFNEIFEEYRLMRRMFQPDPVRLEQAEEAYAGIHTADLLIIDNLGTESPYFQSRLADFSATLQSREQHGLRTIITTNLSVADLGRTYDERLVSRIMGRFEPVPFRGDDLRLVLRRRGRADV